MYLTRPWERCGGGLNNGCGEHVGGYGVAGVKVEEAWLLSPLSRAEAWTRSSESSPSHVCQFIYWLFI
jgi:hypothetical protein